MAFSYPWKQRIIKNVFKGDYCEECGSRGCNFECDSVSNSVGKVTSEGHWAGLLRTVLCCPRFSEYSDGGSESTERVQENWIPS